MKLLICLKCEDVFNLTKVEKQCGCGETKGRYIDNMNAVISGNCKPLGFHNGKFKTAFFMQKMEDEAQAKLNTDVCCEGVPFDAFFIPDTAKSIKRV
jgi:hypothetical protein